MFAQRPENTNLSLLNKCNLIIFWQLNSSFCWRTLRWIYLDEVLFLEMLAENHRLCRMNIKFCIYLQVSRGWNTCISSSRCYFMFQSTERDYTLRICICLCVLEFSLKLGQRSIKSRLKLAAFYTGNILCNIWITAILQKQIKGEKLWSAQMFQKGSKMVWKIVIFIFFSRQGFVGPEPTVVILSKCLFHRPSRKQSGTRQSCLRLRRVGTHIGNNLISVVTDRTELICMYGQSLWGHVVITQPVLCDPGPLSWVEREGWFPLWRN